MKRCKKCGIEKELDDFYKHKNCAADGREGSCKKCRIKHAADYSKTEKGEAVGKRAKAKYATSDKGKKKLADYAKTEKALAFRANYRKSQHGKNVMEEYRKTEKYIESRDASQAKRKKLYPEKHKAVRLVAAAIRRGDMERMPCTVCGDSPSEGHHEDYSKPLDVVWLCRKHHTALHQERRSEARNG